MSQSNKCNLRRRHSAARFITSPLQVGIMLAGFKIDKMVLGGPAHNSGLLRPGDVIVQVCVEIRSFLLREVRGQLETRREGHRK
jgi:C-terminal processing protease CtpA/Prc